MRSVTSIFGNPSDIIGLFFLSCISRTFSRHLSVPCTVVVQTGGCIEGAIFIRYKRYDFEKGISGFSICHFNHPDRGNPGCLRAIELYAEAGPWVFEGPDDGDLYKF